MEWGDLRYFLATLRTGSTAGAARMLGVQHTTVGRRLTALETALSARLFARDAQGMTPTETALALQPLAEDVEARMIDILHLVEGADRRDEGLVRLTCSEAFAGYLFPRLPRLATRFPLITVEVQSANRTYDLYGGEADVAVRMVPTTDTRLISQHLGEAGWSLYAAASYLGHNGRPASTEDLRHHQVIGFDRTMFGSPGAKWLSEHAADQRFCLTVNSVGALVSAVEAGAGLGMMPCFLAEARPHLVRLFDDLIETRAISLVFRPDVGRIARMRRVIDFLRTTLRADRVLLSGTISPVRLRSSPDQSAGQGAFPRGGKGESPGADKVVA